VKIITKSRDESATLTTTNDNDQDDQEDTKHAFQELRRHDGADSTRCNPLDQGNGSFPCRARSSSIKNRDMVIVIHSSYWRSQFVDLNITLAILDFLGLTAFFEGLCTQDMDVDVDGCFEGNRHPRRKLNRTLRHPQHIMKMDNGRDPFNAYDEQNFVSRRYRVWG
jgi:hypothetical protein